MLLTERSAVSSITADRVDDVCHKAVINDCVAETDCITDSTAAEDGCPRHHAARLGSFLQAYSS